MTCVVNVRSTGPGAIYVGRGVGGNIPPVGTRGCYGNPFGRQPLTLYETHLLKRVQRDPAFRAAALALRGQRLACFCAPPEGLAPAWADEARCHGQILAMWIETGAAHEAQTPILARE